MFSCDSRTLVRAALISDEFCIGVDICRPYPTQRQQQTCDGKSIYTRLVFYRDETWLYSQARLWWHHREPQNLAV